MAWYKLRLWCGVMTMAMHVSQAIPCTFSSQFPKWLERYQGTPELDPNLRLGKPDDFTYVFVSGFLNQLLVTYFRDYVKALYTFGVPNRLVFVVHPNSAQGILENVPEVYEKLTCALVFGKKKLVVIGHSKGAAEVLAVAMRYPEFVEEHVERLILIQGPFGGSRIADYLLSEGNNTSVPLSQRVFLSTMEWAQKALAVGPVLESLTPENAKLFWERLIAQHKTAIPVISPKVHYIRSHRRAEDMSRILKPSGEYLEKHYGPNDGFVEFGSQHLPSIGTTAATVYGDHADLSLSYPFSARPARFRQGIMAALVQTLYEVNLE